MDRSKTADYAQNVQLNENETKVVILDQTKLPLEEVYLELGTAKQMYEAIYHLQVRGAPAIGIFAGYAIYCLARQIEETDTERFFAQFQKQKKYLNASRPTAVNLSWALNRMEQVVKRSLSEPVPSILEKLNAECKAIQKEDIAMCKAISEYGLSLLKDGDGILTHCNAGPLATSCYGTALGPFILGKERGMQFQVFADETRPLLQGARLTSYELWKHGVDVTLICDNMAGMVMKNGWVNACFVGCDRVAANGDTANKIGTSQVAILANYYGIPFYVLGPSSTIDRDCKDGSEIIIELREEIEIKEKFYKKAMAPEGVKCYNPAFDVTDHSLIAGIVTEKGICRAPYTESLRKIFES